MFQARQERYNIQTAVDSQFALIVAHAVVLDASDIRCLKPMAEAAKQATEADSFNVVADAGYSNGEQFAQCEAMGMMPFVPVMWSVWGFTILVLAAMFLYRSRLSRDEEDQLFLGDSFRHEQTAQQAIVAKVNKVQPLLRVSEIVAAVATLFVVGYYIMDVVNQFK